MDTLKDQRLKELETAMALLKEKLEYLERVANNYRGDDVETDFARGQKHAIDLVISHIKTIIIQAS